MGSSVTTILGTDLQLKNNNLSVAQILRELTLDEKVSLLSGKEYWRTPSISRLGIKAIKISDGPTGCRGEAIHGSTKAACFPCGSCLGSTFNVDLLSQVGESLGQEAKTKNVGVILGPTINIHRHPLGGRNFEAYSEDPVLSGELAAAYVHGLQSQGVAATPKHFVCNESELHRNDYNSIVDDVTLRELYMLPFQICVGKSKPWALMTAYNKVNGPWCSENKFLIQKVLRKEWGFEGLLMSDFEGVYTEIEPVHAGLNLEMPGPSRQRGAKLIANYKAAAVSETDLDENAKYVIELSRKVGMECDEAPERAVEDVKISAIARAAAAEGFVLLKNESSVLPIPKDSAMKIAVFGAPASASIIHGGGSSSVSSLYTVQPLDAIRASFKNVSYLYGLPIFRKVPSASKAIMKTASGEEGVDCYWFNGSIIGENQILHERLDTTRTLVIDPRIKGLEANHCTRMSFTLTPETSGTHTFGVTANGETHIIVDCSEILSHPGYTDTKVEYIMQPGRFEHRTTMPMEASRPYKVVIDTYGTTAPPPPPPAFQMPPQATQVGFFENLGARDVSSLERLASESDISIVFTGNTKEYESESFDRENLDLGASQNEMVSAIARNSRKTIVVNQTGAAISMPWLNEVDSVIQCWFAGMEVGNALADILTGAVSPSGRLPVTFPAKSSDVPSNSNFPCDRDKNLRYDEGLKVGYRALMEEDAPEPLFVFGHGLSYSVFGYSNLKVSRLPSDELEIEVSVKITNTSTTAGKEVMQVYVNGILKTFSKPFLQAGDQKTVNLTLNKMAFAHWDVEIGAWRVQSGVVNIDVRKDARTVILGQKWEIGDRDKSTWI